MNSKKVIQKEVEETLKSTSYLRMVKAPPFFKDKVLYRLAQQSTNQREENAFLSWFTPKYQAVALLFFVFLNVAAILTYSSERYGENISDFVAAYQLSETDTNSYIY